MITIPKNKLIVDIKSKEHDHLIRTAVQEFLIEKLREKGINPYFTEFNTPHLKLYVRVFTDDIIITANDATYANLETLAKKLLTEKEETIPFEDDDDYYYGWGSMCGFHNQPYVYKKPVLSFYKRKVNETN